MLEWGFAPSPGSDYLPGALMTEAQAAALGYLAAWLEGKTTDESMVRSFGAVRNGSGGIACVRVKVFDTVLAIIPWETAEAHPTRTHLVAVPQPVTRNPAMEDALITHIEARLEEPEPEPEARAKASRPNYGGAERYKCPSCGARQWEFCVTKNGTKAYVPHSARDHMVTT